VRASWLLRFGRNLLQDLRFGARMLARSPSFTCIAVLALALGIGANTAIFSVVHAVLLKPLPYPEPERVVHLAVTHTREGGEDNVSYPDFLEWRQQQRSFVAVAAYDPCPLVLSIKGEPTTLRGISATAAFFNVLGMRPLVGRAFVPEDDVAHAPPVVILGYDVWRERFGGDVSVAGSQIRLDGRPFTVIGVMPPGARSPMTGSQTRV
jgi:hypothetical protein